MEQSVGVWGGHGSASRWLSELVLLFLLCSEVPRPSDFWYMWLLGGTGGTLEARALA